MTQLKRDSIIGALFVLITGTLSHFLYEWSGKLLIAGLFTPVNESVWEHMKLVFFPMLLCASVMNGRLRKKYPGISSALPLGILLGTFLVPFFFYSYTLLIGRDLFFFDLASFVLSVAIAFYIVYRLALSGMAAPFRIPLSLLVFIVLVCFLFFTCQAPRCPLFADPENPTAAICGGDVF